MVERQAVADARRAEEVMGDLWCHVLGRRAGSSEHFIDLGGNSLRAMQLVARLQEVFECEMPLTVVFEYPTISSLLDQVARLCGGADAMERHATAWYGRSSTAAS